MVLFSPFFYCSFPSLILRIFFPTVFFSTAFFHILSFCDIRSRSKKMAFSPYFTLSVLLPLTDILLHLLSLTAVRIPRLCVPFARRRCLLQVSSCPLLLCSHFFCIINGHDTLILCHAITKPLTFIPLQFP